MDTHGTKELINWSAMTQIWECYETMGISPLNIHQFEDELLAPLCIVGGGSGINIEYLYTQGMEVESVDCCKEMIDLAKKRRGIDIKYASGENLPFFQNQFSSLIISTGIFNKTTLYSSIFDSVINEARRVLKPGGKLFIGYFIASSDLDYVFEVLGLDVTPSNNRYFTNADNLMQVRDRFLRDSNISEPTVNYLFDNYDELLNDHLALMKEVSITLNEKELNSEDFVSKYIGFNYRDLWEQDERYLQHRISELAVIQEKVTLIPGDVRLMKCTLKE